MLVYKMRSMCSVCTDYHIVKVAVMDFLVGKKFGVSFCVTDWDQTE